MENERTSDTFLIWPNDRYERQVEFNRRGGRVAIIMNGDRETPIRVLNEAEVRGLIWWLDRRTTT